MVLRCDLRSSGTIELPGLFEGGIGVVKNGACGGVSSMNGGIAAVIALVWVRVGVVTSGLAGAAARRGGRGIFGGISCLITLRCVRFVHRMTICC